MAVRLLIVDEEELSRLRLRIFVEDIACIATIDECRSLTEATELAKDQDLSLSIVKTRSQFSQRFAASIRELKEVRPAMQLLLLPPDTSPLIGADVLDIIDGICPASSGPAELHTAVQLLRDGFFVLDNSIAAKYGSLVTSNAGECQSDSSEAPRLISRIADNMQPAQICHELQITPHEYHQKLRAELKELANKSTDPQVRVGSSQLCMSCGREYPDLPSGSRCPADGAKLLPIGETPMLGQILEGRFELTEFVGNGGVGDVYKARDLTLNSWAAVKFLNDRTLHNESFVRRLSREAEVLAQLDHPNVVKFLGSGASESGMPFVAMSFEEGVSLEDVLSETGALPLSEAIPIFVQVCDALSHAHSRGIIHRDLTPRNIMIARSAAGPEAKLIDFGLSKWVPRIQRSKTRLTNTGLVCGTPSYMSPEQCTGRAIDERSDIYSMGCILYETLTGVPPFIGVGVADTLRKQVQEEAPNIASLVPNLPAALTKLVNQCLQKKPEKRPRTAQEIKKVLNSLPR